MSRFSQRSKFVWITGNLTPIDIALFTAVLGRRGMTATQRVDLPAEAILINDWNCLASNVAAIVEAGRCGLPVIVSTAMARKEDIAVMAAAGARVVKKPNGILTLPFAIHEEINAATARYRRYA